MADKDTSSVADRGRFLLHVDAIARAAAEIMTLGPGTDRTFELLQTIRADVDAAAGINQRFAPDLEDYTADQTFNVGDRVELSPACDLWMRGARFGTIAAVAPIRVRMDHPSVKRLIVVNHTLIRHVRA